MRSRTAHSPERAFSRTLVVLAIVPAGCATDSLALAPSTPDRPWAMSTSVTPAAASPGDKGLGLDKNIQDIARTNAVPIDPRRHYDLAALIDLAQRNNPLTREAWERARQAALGVGLAETSYVPQISAEIVGGFQHTPLPIPTTLVPQGYFTSNSRELIPSLTAKWLLFDFGQRASTVDVSRANAFAANVAFTGAHQNLIYAVSRDYFALGATRGRLKVARQALKNADIVEDAVRQKRNNGLATVVELAQARRETAQAQFNLVRATGNDHTARAALVASVGIALDARIEIADNADQKLPGTPEGDLDRLVQGALANRPDIVASVAKLEGAEAALRGAHAAYYPTIAVEGQVYQNVGALNTNGSRYYSVNEPGANILLKLSVPLFDGGARAARVAAAQSELGAAHDSLDQVRDTAVQQVTDAYDALRTSFAEYESSLPLTAAASTAYDAALDAYRHGVGTYTDLINDETALDQAQSEKEDAHANVFTAAAALAFATGAVLAPGQ